MKEIYIDFIEKVFGAYTNEHIKTYTDSVKNEGLKEHGYPRLVANLGILIAHGRKTELKDDFIKMMRQKDYLINFIYKKDKEKNNYIATSKIRWQIYGTFFNE